MNFIQKHYEKMILAVLLVVFVFSLIYLIDIIKSTHNITEKDLQIKPGKVDYENFDFSGEQFKYDKAMMRLLNWKESSSRDGNQILYSDLLVPIVSARCPKCRYFIPMYYFKEVHNCPLCSAELPEPWINHDDMDAPIGADADRDGMPNAFEKNNRLDPFQWYDGIMDRDFDGFANNYGYLMKTNIEDPKDHPDFTLRLYVEDMKAVPFGASLKRAKMEGDKSQWELYIGSGRGNGSLRRVGDTITVDRRKYKIIDAGMRQVTDDKGESKELPFAAIEGVDADNAVRYNLVLDMPTDTDKATATIRDISDYNFKVKAEVGNTFKIGNPKTGVEEFKIIGVDLGSQRIELSNTTKNVESSISSMIQIPEKYRIGNQQYYIQREMLRQNSNSRGGNGSEGMARPRY